VPRPCDHAAVGARLVLAFVMLPIAVSACGSSGGSRSTATPTEPPPSTATETSPPPTRVLVFFLRDGKVAVARRDVEATDAIGTAALNALFEGPNAEERQAGMTSAVPAGEQLESLSIANGVATVELSRDLDGPAAAQVIYTLKQFPTVKSVAVPVVDGARTGLERYTPAILIRSPVVGDSVMSPLHVTGTANTFEATFHLEVRTGGRLVDKRTVTATSGSGVRGTFGETIPFTVSEETPARVIAYELSAENGKRINEVSVPIGLLP